MDPTPTLAPGGATPALPAALRGLRVAIVHDWLTGLRGGEKCLEVVCAAFPDATLHTLIHREGAVGPTIGGMAIRTSPLQKVPGVFRHYRHLLPVMPLAARSWRVGEVDLVLSLSHCVAKAVRVPPGVPHVCYCFTPMRYAWDGRAAYLEGWTGRPLRRRVVGAVLDRLRAWDRGTAARVSHFVAISRTVRGRIARCYGRDAAIIEPPVDTSFYTPDGGPRGGDYLCVSALVPYKRIDQAVEACRRTGRSLVVIGSGPDRERLERLAGPTVRFLGWQPDEVIRDHLRRCRALLFPGEEDFGIVPIEALACGSPVIALNRGGAAETIDNAVGRVYDAPTADGLVGALDAWEAAGGPHDGAEARRRAERLATAVFRERLLGFLAEVAAGARAGRGLPGPHLRSAARRAARRESV
jgi:glycosyltransferase involved in cell wall biosynthesis